MRPDLDGAGRGGARAAALRQPDHQRHSRRSRPARASWRRPASTACSSRSRTSTRTAPRGSRGATISTAKLEVAAAVRALGLPLTLNVVHPPRQHRARRRVRRAGGADRRRTAGAREHAVPRLGAREPGRAAAGARGHRTRRAPSPRPRAERLRGKIEILFVRPDYYADRPRACMDGWARRYIVVTPDGVVLPCHQAGSIAGLPSRPSRARPLAAIWSDSPALRAYRGDAWMPAPCRTCDERHTDFGGCRCQAFALLGDAGATDPACALSPRHDIVRAARARADAAARRGRPAADSPAPDANRPHDRGHRGRGAHQDVR